MKLIIMQIGVFIMVVLGCGNLTDLMAQQKHESLNVVLRVIPNQRSYLFKCAAINTGSENVEIPVAREFMADGNSFGFIELDDKSRRRSSIGVLTSFVELPPPLVIAGNTAYTRCVRKEEMMGHVERNFSDKYVDLFWFVGKVSPSITVAFPDADGNIAPPVVAPRDPTGKPILAFIFHEKKPYELGFLFLNGTDADIAIEKPLTQASRIVASAPAIKYTRELILPKAQIEKAIVDAGKVGEWRIPWQKVFELIPKEDMEKIKAAGGDLDLVWKVGEYESAPLPLSLSEPENNDEGDEDDDDDAPDGE